MDVDISDDGPLGLVPDGWPPGPVRIAVVLPGSEAEKHELRPGDELRGVNGRAVAELSHRSLALELAKRPLKLQIQRQQQVVIDINVDADAGAMGFFPKHWPPGPVVVGAVLPKKIAHTHGVREGDLLWLVAGEQASLMSPVSLTAALSQRPTTLRFVRGDSNAVAKDLSQAPSEAGVLQQHRELQVQQLHLQQLQHRKEQEVKKAGERNDSDWLCLLERQQLEKSAMQSLQREHLWQLGDALKEHQELLGSLNRDRGTGYATVMPAMPKIPVAKLQLEATRVPGEVQDLELEAELEQPTGQIPDLQDQNTSEQLEVEEVLPDLPEPLESLEQTSQPSIPSPAFCGEPLSLLEPADSLLLEMPKTAQRQLRAAREPERLLEPAAPEQRRLREVPPPEKPPGDLSGSSDLDLSSSPESRDMSNLQSWLARSSLSPDTVIF